MEKIPYWIMSGSGNDFVIVDNRQGLVDEEGLRRLNVLVKEEGIDGLLLLEDSVIADFKMRIINPDGSEAQMCGNGARCISRFAQMKGIVQKTVNIETLAGIIQAEVINTKVKLRMTDPTNIFLNKELWVNGEAKIVHCINTGVPHAVLIEEELEGIDVVGLGRAIRFHQEFQPEGTNVDFVNILDGKRIGIRTYERGVEDETLACGTGAAAGACIAYLIGKVELPVEVWPKSKEILRVYFEDCSGRITNLSLEGGVEFIRGGEV